MSTAPLPPQRVEVDGETWEIRRAWPSGAQDEGAPPRLAVEAVGAGPDAATPRTLHVRAGRWRDGAVSLQRAGTDRRLPALAELAREGQVISHRPGRRAVVRTRLGAVAPGQVERAPEDEAFVKIVRPGKAAALLRGIEQAGAFDGAFRTPAVLAADDSTVTLAGLAGHSLHDPAPFDDASWSRAWREILQARRAAVERPAVAGAKLSEGGSADAPVHGPEEEIAVLHRWAGLTAPFRPDPARVDRLVAAAARRLAALPAVAPRPAHRDLHDKQLLWSPAQGPGLLDVDTACLADPALDLGNLRAHASWRRRQRLWTPTQSEVVRAAVDAAAAGERIDPQRLAAYEQASLVRLVCVYAVRPPYAALAEELARALDGSPEDAPGSAPIG